MRETFISIQCCATKHFIGQFQTFRYNDRSIGNAERISRRRNNRCEKSLTQKVVRALTPKSKKIPQKDIDTEALLQSTFTGRELKMAL